MMIRIAATEIVISPGNEPTRIVMSQHDTERFCTHWELVPRYGEEPYIVAGHYDMTREEAEADMKNRLQKLKKGMS